MGRCWQPKTVVRSWVNERGRQEPAKMQARRDGGRTGTASWKGESCLRRLFSRFYFRAFAGCCSTVCSGESCGSYRVSCWQQWSGSTLARSLRFWPGWNSCVWETSRWRQPLPVPWVVCSSAGSSPRRRNRARAGVECPGSNSLIVVIGTNCLPIAGSGPAESVTHEGEGQS